MFWIIVGITLSLVGGSLPWAFNPHSNVSRGKGEQFQTEKPEAYSQWTAGSLGQVDPNRFEVGVINKAGENLGPVDLGVIAQLLGAGLDGGASLPQVLAVAGKTCGEPELIVVSRALLLGVTWEKAWIDVSERLSELEKILRPGWCEGVGVVPILRRFVQNRQRQQVRLSRQAANKLGVKILLPLTLCYLPAFVVLGVLPVIFTGAVSFLKW